MKHLLATTAAATGLICSLSFAHAATYTVDFQLNDNATFELTTLMGTTTMPFTPLHVTGQITTDGTIGALSEANFVSWEFQVGGFVGFSNTQAYGQSHDPANGYSFSIENMGLDQFTATATDLVAGPGNWRFGASLDNGLAISYIGFGVSDPRQGLTFASETVQGPISAKYSASDADFASGKIGSAVPAPVPLPATLPMLLGVLAIAGLAGRRRA